MRFTNHFPHPADNRYDVFVFRDPARAADFKQRCQADGIPFESHEEDDELLFGIHKDYLKRAHQHNMAVIAAHRKPFIPNPGFRWTLLLVTLVAVLLALAGAWNAARSQESRILEWGLAGFAPAAWAGVEDIPGATDGLTCVWQPEWGSGFGARITTPTRGAWSWSTGLQLVRLRSTWSLQHASGTAGELILRTVRYRIPVLAGTHVPLTSNTAVHLLLGPVLDFMPSDAVASGETTTVDSTFHSFVARESRIRGWAIPLSAEVGVSWRSAPGAWGLYLGGFFSQELARNRWGEAAWAAGSDPTESVRFWSGLATAGVEVRVILP